MGPCEKIVCFSLMCHLCGPKAKGSHFAARKFAQAPAVVAVLPATGKSVRPMNMTVHQLIAVAEDAFLKCLNQSRSATLLLR